MTPTPCETCDHVHPATANKEPWKWMCLKFPRLAGLDPVAPTQRIVLEPYNRCTAINVGFCPVWQPRREPKGEEQ
jgi:hypothetical protein